MRKISILCLTAVVLFGLSSCKGQEGTGDPFSSVSVSSEREAQMQSSSIESESVTSESSISSETVSASSLGTVSEKLTLPSQPTKPPTVSATSSKASSQPIYKPTLDYHNLPDSALQLYSSLDFDQNDIELYHKMVDAYLNFESTVPFDTATQLPHSVLRLLWFHCPVFFADTAIGVDFADYNTGRVKITYTSKNAYEHGLVIKKFEDSCRPFLDGLGSNDTETERALICYHRFVKSLKYDYEFAEQMSGKPFHFYAEDNPSYNETYIALTEHTGVCSAFSVGYNFLLSQLDIEAYYVGADHKTESVSHAWSMLKLNGKWFFADPTWDAVKGNSSIAYFGVQTLERATNGYLVDRYRISDMRGVKFSDFAVVRDFRFAPLSAGAHAPIFDRAKNTVTYTDKSGEQKTFDLT